MPGGRVAAWNGFTRAGGGAAAWKGFTRAGGVDPSSPEVACCASRCWASSTSALSSNAAQVDMAKHRKQGSRRDLSAHAIQDLGRNGIRDSL